MWCQNPTHRQYFNLLRLSLPHISESSSFSCRLPLSISLISWRPIKIMCSRVRVWSERYGEELYFKQQIFTTINANKLVKQRWANRHTRGGRKIVPSKARLRLSSFNFIFICLIIKWLRSTSSPYWRNVLRISGKFLINCCLYRDLNCASFQQTLIMSPESVFVPFHVERRPDKQKVRRKLFVDSPISLKMVFHNFF